MIFPILFWTSWTGIILPGRLTNTSMPSCLASAHLWWWHPIQIHRIRALLYTFKWFLEGIHSSRQRDIQRMPLEFQDTQLATQQRKGKKERSWKYSGSPSDHHSYHISSCWLLVLFNVTTVTPPFDVLSTFIVDLPWANFGFSLLLTLHSLLLFMANRSTDGLHRMLPAPSSMTLTNTTGPHLPPDDPTSASYIPRAARMIPTSITVHTIFIKKLSYPFTSRPDELWIIEQTADGRETWKPVETFLENMHLTRDRATLRTTANNWRQYYDIPIPSSSSSTATSFPVLPHPEHSNVRVSQPFDAIPDQLHILQSCCIIHRVPLFLYLGHHGDLHHHPHHQQHFTGPYTRTTLLHPDINLTDQYHLTNRALWICLTPACNAPLRFATVKKTDYMGFYWLLNVVQIFLPLFSRYSSLPFGNFVTMQLGLNLLSLMPWLLPLVLIHIALHPRWTHLKALELRHGLLDTEAFLATGTLLHPDPSWS